MLNSFENHIKTSPCYQSNHKKSGFKQYKRQEYNMSAKMDRARTLPLYLKLFNNKIHNHMVILLQFIEESK